FGADKILRAGHSDEVLAANRASGGSPLPLGYPTATSIGRLPIRHGAQLAFVGIFCGFARARLERNQDLRNQQVAIRDTMLGAEPRNLLICPHVVSDQDRKNSLLRRLPLSL